MGMNVMSDLMSLYGVLTIVSKANGFAQLEKRSFAWQGEALKPSFQKCRVHARPLHCDWCLWHAWPWS